MKLMFTPLCAFLGVNRYPRRDLVRRKWLSPQHMIPHGPKHQASQGVGLALLSGSREGSSLSSTSAHYLQTKLWKGKRAEIHSNPISYTNVSALISKRV